MYLVNWIALKNKIDFTVIYKIMSDLINKLEANIAVYIVNEFNNNNEISDSFKTLINTFTLNARFIDTKFESISIPIMFYVIPDIVNYSDVLTIVKTIDFPLYKILSLKKPISNFNKMVSLFYKHKLKMNLSIELPNDIFQKDIFAFVLYFGKKLSRNDKCPFYRELFKWLSSWLSYYEYYKVLKQNDIKGKVAYTEISSIESLVINNIEKKHWILFDINTDLFTMDRFIIIVNKLDFSEIEGISYVFDEDLISHGNKTIIGKNFNQLYNNKCWKFNY
jgi:hypothetical protein